MQNANSCINQHCLNSTLNISFRVLWCVKLEGTSTSKPTHMAIPTDRTTEEQEEDEHEHEHEHESSTHHPSPPSDEFFDLSTTVDPGYIISLIRKLLPLGSASFHGVISDGPDQGSLAHNKEERDVPVSISNDEHLESSKNKTDNMDVDVSDESSHPPGDNQDTGDGFEHSGASVGEGGFVGEGAWEEHGCILWDLAACKTHAELMVENLILEVLLANLTICKSVRVTEICIGIVGNLACHEVPMQHIVSTDRLIETIVDKLFMDDPQCLCEIYRLFTVGLQSGKSVKWAEALQSEQILCQILWITENTLNLQLLEKSVGLILAISESQQQSVDALLPPMMEFGLSSILINLLTFEIDKLTSERIPERYSILDLILRAIEALSIMDDYSPEICSSKELFQLACNLVKYPDKVEVGNCCVTAAVLIANILSDVADRASEISQDWCLLGNLLDVFPFASDDLEARNALWNVIARILIRIHENEMSPSSIGHFVLVLVSRIDLIEDELLNQQFTDSSHEQESLSSPRSRDDARNTSLKRIINILNQWSALKENAENNGNAEVLVNEKDVQKLIDCCQKFSK